jgi:hypothetical protein
MKFIVDATREREHSGRSGRRTCDEGHAACMEEQEPAGRHQISVGWIVDREEQLSSASNFESNAAIMTHE